MVYVLFSEIIGNIGKVKAIIYNVRPDQLEENGFYAEFVPQADTPEGMYPVLMMRIEQKELYYNYEAFPESTDLIDQTSLLEQIIESTAYLVDVDYRLSLVELGLN